MSKMICCRRPYLRTLPVRNSAFTLIELLTVIAIIAILASILIPVVATARESARKSQCMSNMRQVGLAVLAYESENGVLPGPAYRRIRRPFVTDQWHNYELNWILEDYVGAEKSEVWDCPTNAMVYGESQNPGSVTFVLKNGSGTLPSNYFGYPDRAIPIGIHQIQASRRIGPGRLLTEPSMIWMLTDADGQSYSRASLGSEYGAGSVPLSDDALPCHGDGRNYVFFDGHAEYIRISDFPP